MLLAVIVANRPAMTIAAPQATFLKPATSLDVQVLVSSSSGGMVPILARSRSFARPRVRPSACRFQVAGQPLPPPTSGYGRYCRKSIRKGTVKSKFETKESRRTIFLNQDCLLVFDLESMLRRD